MTKTFEADVIEFILPNRRIKYHKVPLPIDVEENYKKMEKAGNRLETEILRDGNVSTTITSEEEDIEIEITNEPTATIAGIIKMLKKVLP